MRDCLFCKIVDRKIAADVIYEDKDTLAFLDIQPRAIAHTMVISKVHSETILDLPDDQIEPTFLTVKKVVDILKNVFKPDGFTIGINQGRVSGQAVEHLHIHIIPRFKNDRGTSIHSVVNSPSKESNQSIVDKIKKYYNK